MRQNRILLLGPRSTDPSPATAWIALLADLLSATYDVRIICPSLDRLENRNEASIRSAKLTARTKRDVIREFYHLVDSYIRKGEGQRLYIVNTQRDLEALQATLEVVPGPIWCLDPAGLGVTGGTATASKEAVAEKISNTVQRGVLAPEAAASLLDGVARNRISKSLMPLLPDPELPPGCWPINLFEVTGFQCWLRNAVPSLISARPLSRDVTVMMPPAAEPEQTPDDTEPSMAISPQPCPEGALDPVSTISNTAAVLDLSSPDRRCPSAYAAAAAFSGRLVIGRPGLWSLALGPRFIPLPRGPQSLSLADQIARCAVRYWSETNVPHDRTDTDSPFPNLGKMPPLPETRPELKLGPSDLWWQHQQDRNMRSAPLAVNPSVRPSEISCLCGFTPPRVWWPVGLPKNIPIFADLTAALALSEYLDLPPVLALARAGYADPVIADPSIDSELQKKIATDAALTLITPDTARERVLRAGSIGCFDPQAPGNYLLEPVRGREASIPIPNRLFRTGANTKFGAGSGQVIWRNQGDRALNLLIFCAVPGAVIKCKADFPLPSDITAMLEDETGAKPSSEGYFTADTRGVLRVRLTLHKAKHRSGQARGLWNFRKALLSGRFLTSIADNQALSEEQRWSGI